MNSKKRLPTFVAIASATAMLLVALGPREALHAFPADGREPVTGVLGTAHRGTSAAATGTVDVSVSVVDSPDPVTVGSDLTYAVTATNGGPETATQVSVTDALPAATTFVSASPPCAYDSAAHAVSCALDSLPGGGAAGVQIVVQPTADGTIANTARVNAAEEDSDPANNSVTESTTVEAAPQAHADLAIFSSDSPDPATVGDELTYTMRVRNNGPDASPRASVVVGLPSSVTFVSARAAEGTCAESGGTVTCTIGTLGSGARTSITVVVVPLTAEMISSTASVTVDGIDPDPSNDQTTEPTTVQAAAGTADLSLTKTDSSDPVTVGSKITYTLTATNAGPDEASDVVVTDHLPQGVSFVSATPKDVCAFRQAVNSVVCSLGRLAASSSATATVSVSAETSGTVTNTADVTAGQSDPQPENNTAVQSTTITSTSGAASITVSDYSFTPKAVAARQGSVVTWSFKGPLAHTATDRSGMGLFGSGRKAAGTSYSFGFPWAGNYGYKCAIHPTRMQGSVNLPPKVSPASGDAATSFTVTWASATPPSGYVEDAQIKRPGSTSYVNWKTGLTSTSAAFVPDAGAGNYLFRSRLRKPSVGKASRWSAPVAIEVVTPSSTSPVVVAGKGAARSVSPSFLGLNGNNVAGPTWNDPGFLAALRSFGPGTLRYPGGTVGNYWDWEQGWFQQNGPWPSQPKTRIDNTVGTFASAANATGAIPVFVLNQLTYQGSIATEAHNADMLSEQIRFLKAAQAGGLPVRLVEIGNEFYLRGPVDGNTHYEQRFPTASDYAAQTNPWIAAVRQAFPGAKIAAVGADVPGTVGTRRRTWNATVLEQLSGHDALTLHVYIIVTNADASPQSLLSLPYKRFRQLEANELELLRSQGTEAWVTEYNLTDKTPDRTFAGTWMHGLFASTMTLLFLRDGVVRHIDLHNVVGNAMSAAIFSNSKGFGSTGPATVPMALTAAGQGLALIQRALKGATSGQAISFQDVPTLDGGSPALIGSVLTGSRRQAVVVNLSAQPITVNFENVMPGAFGYERLQASSLTTRVTGPDSVIVTNGTGTTTLTLTPHSLTRLFE